MEALSRLGLDSIPALIQNLEGSDDEKVRELSLKTLVYLQPDSIHSILERAIEYQADEAKKNNLKKALMDMNSENDSTTRC